MINSFLLVEEEKQAEPEAQEGNKFCPNCGGW